MKIWINGETRNVKSTSSVADLVREFVDEAKGVAVAVDGEVVPRSSWDNTPAREGQRVEIVRAVQGG